MNEEMLRQFADTAMQHSDDTGRIARIMHRTATEPMRIAALGGSVTFGYTPSGNIPPYPELLCDLLPFPTALRNLAVAGTDAYLGLLLTARDIQQFSPDIVLVEYAVNQSVSTEMMSVYEGLLHRLLTLPSKPAIVTVMCVNKSGYTCENCMAHVARHYGLSVISVRDGLQQLSWEDYSQDEVHPHRNGQVMLAQAVYMVLTQSKRQNGYHIPDVSCLNRELSPLRLCDLHAGSGGRFVPVPFLHAFGTEDAVILESDRNCYTLKETGSMFVVYFRQSNAPDTANAVLTVDDCTEIELQAASINGWGNPAAVRIIPKTQQTTHTLSFRLNGSKGQFILWAVAAV